MPELDIGGADSGKRRGQPGGNVGRIGLWAVPGPLGAGRGCDGDIGSGLGSNYTAGGGVWGVASEEEKGGIGLLV